MANIYSLQLLRNGQIFTSYTAAKDAILTSTTQDGVIKLARYTDSTATSGDSKYQTSTVKTIFGIYANFAGGTGWTIFDSYHEVIQNLQGQIDSMTGGTGSIAQQIDAALNQLDYSGVTTGNGVVVTNVRETNGTVEATAAEVGGLQLTNYDGASSGTVAAGDTINVAISKLQNQITEKDAEADAAIEALDATIDAADGFIIGHIEQVDGKISGTTKELPTVAAITEAGKPIIAVAEDKGTISASAGTIEAQYVTVADAGSAFTASTVEAVLAEIDAAYKAADEAIVDNASESANTLAKLEDLINDATSEAKSYSIKAITGTDLANLDVNAREAFKLVDEDGVQAGETIKIYKDQTLKNAEYSGQSLILTYILADGSESAVTIDMHDLIEQTEFASGVTWDTTASKVRGVVDTQSESFLTVGADGFKLSGVQDAIEDAIEALVYTGITTSDAAVVTNVTEADGVVAATAANVGSLKLTGYESGQTGDVEATDTINQAFSKLQKQIDDAEAAAAGAHTVVTKDASAAHLTLTSTTDSNTSAVTYEIGETNIASQSDLETVSGKVDNAQAEIDAIETAVGLTTGGTYSADTTNAYTSAATSVADAINKLDDATATNAAAIEALEDGFIGGVSVNSVDLTETDNKVNIAIEAGTAAANDANAIHVDTNSTTGAITLTLGTLDCGEYN